MVPLGNHRNGGILVIMGVLALGCEHTRCHCQGEGRACVYTIALWKP
jgi:hypothetical protein